MGSTGERIGLLPYMRWLAGHRFWVTLLLCWMISPVGMLVVILAGESRMPSLDWNLQFLSFFPGDFFLGTAMAVLLYMAQELPDERRWYNSLPWHVSLQVFTLACAGLLTYGEFKQGYYSTGAMLSPSKVYHHIGLYGIYGYAVLSTFVAVVFGTWRARGFARRMAICLVFVVTWMALVYHDATLTPDQARPKAPNAHVADWKPFWENPWLIGIFSQR